MKCDRRKIGGGQTDLIKSFPVSIERDPFFQHSAIFTNGVCYPNAIENAHRVGPHQYGRTNFQQFLRLNRLGLLASAIKLSANYRMLVCLPNLMRRTREI